jgi:GNAT superfamily N-acetyltransferase
MDRVAVVRAASSADVEACVEIVRCLPDFFTPDTHGKVRSDLARHSAWVLEEVNECVGFAVVDRRSLEAVEILWAAFRPDRRGEGLGTRLIEEVLRELANDGVNLVEVKTLDRSSRYAAYEPTRVFWERRGFVQIDTIDPLPSWQPGNPAALYVAALRSTT